MVTEADNKAPELRKYDPNHALKLSGLRELTPVQSEAFEKWWKLFFTFEIDEFPKTDHLFMVFLCLKDYDFDVKQLFEKCATSERDDDDHKRDDDDVDDDEKSAGRFTKLIGKAAQENFF